MVDARGGCPDRNFGANQPLLTKTITMDKAGSAFATGSIIRHMHGRSDIYLQVDGATKRYALTYTSSAQWEQADITWAGALSSGSHTIEVKSTRTGDWGCTAPWGSLNVAKFEGADDAASPKRRMESG